MDLSLMKSLDTREITAILNKAMLFGGLLQHPTQNSNQTSVIKSMAMNDQGQILIDLDKELSLTDSWHISVKLNYRNLFFYLAPGQFQKSGTTLITELPKEARALARRDNERYILPLNTQLAGQIHRIEKRGVPSDLNVQVLDVSSRGLGLLLHNNEEELLGQNDHIWLHKIHNIQLPQPIFGRIIYVINRKFKDGKVDAKIGISLEHSLSHEVMAQIKQHSQLVLFA